MVASEHRNKKIERSVGKSLSFLSPNQWTLVSLFVALGAGWSFWSGELLNGIILFFAAVVLDFVDGAVAKTTGRVSKFGALFDHSVDKYIEGIVILSLGAIGAPLFGISAFLIAGFAAWSSILVGTIDSKAGEVWGKRGGLKLYGRAERMGVLFSVLILSLFFGGLMLSAGLLVFALVSQLTSLVLLVEYSKRR